MPTHSHTTRLTPTRAGRIRPGAPSTARAGVRWPAPPSAAYKAPAPAAGARQI